MTRTMDAEEYRHAQDQAAVLMGLWGSGTDPEPWRGFAFADDAAPDFMERPRHLTQADYRSVLVSGLSDIHPPDGWEIVASYMACEAECPQCGPGTEREHMRPECDLCEGDGLLYWGEDFRLVVFGPIRGTDARHHVIQLTDGEHDAIEWACGRYGWGDLWRELCVDEGDDDRQLDDPADTRMYCVTNREALEWVRAAGEDDSPYACASPELEAKLRTLATEALELAELED